MKQGQIVLILIFSCSICFAKVLLTGTEKYAVPGVVTLVACLGDQLCDNNYYKTRSNQWIFDTEREALEYINKENIQLPKLYALTELSLNYTQVGTTTEIRKVETEFEVPVFKWELKS